MSSDTYYAYDYSMPSSIFRSRFAAHLPHIFSPVGILDLPPSSFWAFLSFQILSSSAGGMDWIVFRPTFHTPDLSVPVPPPASFSSFFSCLALLPCLATASLLAILAEWITPLLNHTPVGKVTFP